VLTSPQNPRLKAVAALRRHRARDREGRILIDGHRALALALEAGVAVETVLHCPDRDGPGARAAVADAARRGVAVEPVAGAAFARIAYGARPDSVVAVARRPGAGLTALEGRGGTPLLLVLAGLEKPGNLGALLRTADAAGAHGVLVCGPGCDPFGPNVVRASRGTVFTVPVAEADTEAALAWLRARGVALVAAVPDADTAYTDAPLSGPVAIVLGAEDRGLPPVWREAADVAVRVPMHGRADSLNVSVTGALLLYEALRRRAAAD
jgi:TrmH family RNA methyltransferase